MTGNVFEDGKPFSAAALNSMKDAHANRGVLEGLDLSPGEGDFEVDVSSGEIAVGETTIAVDADTVEHDEAGEADRIDLVTADAEGDLDVVTGEEAEEDGQPVAPEIPTDEVLVGLVYVRGGAVAIEDGDLHGEYRTPIDRLRTPVYETMDDLPETNATGAFAYVAEEETVLMTVPKH